MKRLPGEFHQALHLLASRQKTDASAKVLELQPRPKPGSQTR
jgi:hypothetical protein